MFIQISTFQVLNLDHLLTFYTDDKGEDYQERYIIQFVGTNDRSWSATFKHHSVMMKAYNELLRVTKTVEWKSD